MTDWAAISMADFTPPTGRRLGELVDELTEALTSPDRVRRDAILPALAEVLHLAFPHQA
ncbi:MAG TPA: hypothetical protein VH641_14725 [Streptosporangiaceae bacterium]|jgi:hypothetical protein